MAALVMAVVWASTAKSQTAPAPAVTLEEALRRLYEQADVVFAGEVLAIDREPGGVLVRWHVDDAVQGTAAAAVYTLREWPGLWASGEARYAVGQRALVLLHAPSASGYASAVGGPDGVIQLRGRRGSQMLDLRLLTQRVLATDAARLRPMRMLQGQSANDAPAPKTNASVGVSDDAGNVDGGVILSLLHAWQQEKAAGR